MTTRKERCVVADDHPAIVDILVDHLGLAGHEVVAVARDGHGAVEAVATHRPSVVVTDLRMPHLERRALLDALTRACPDTKIVVYTAEADRDLWLEASAAGAHALVLKEAPMTDVARAIAAVLSGRPYVDGGIDLSDAGGSAPLRLTSREAEVLGLLADGLTHEQIAPRLEIATDTVRTHVKKATSRLRAANRTEAVAIALRRGLIT